MRELDKLREEMTGETPARRRITQLLDPGSFVELDLFVGQGVVTGFGTIAARPAYVYAQDKGAMGQGQSAKVVRLLNLAMDAGAPVVAICDSPGALLMEGAGAQDAYAGIFAAHAKLSGVVPQVALILGDCVGQQAVAARMCDFVVMSEQGYMNQLPPQVLAATLGKDVDKAKLGGGKANLASGNCDMAYDDEASAIAGTRALLGMLPSNCQEEVLVEAADDLNRLTAAGLTDPRDLIPHLADGNIVLQAGNRFNCATALIRMGGRTVGIVAAQEEICHRALDAATAFVRKMDAFNIPVITLINVKKLHAPENAITTRALGALAYAYQEASVPKITLIAGNAYGPLYSVLGSRPLVDMVLAWPNAAIAPIVPEIAADMLYPEDLKKFSDVNASRAKLVEKYLQDVADIGHAAKKGLVDAICEEADTRKTLLYIVDMLSAKRVPESLRKHGSI